jgi:hypothetical protein
MKESLKKKICEALPDWLIMTYEKSDHGGYTKDTDSVQVLFG